uniref:NADH-ubiquinone oxidoreductase chain 2 n=1 Tax=Henosepilachna argus TaxID=1587345 RepID=A0A5J6NV10_9CUCU|nr:NADH dehydrogenase subunit 2 [Henosepilachna argus]
MLFLTTLMMGTLISISSFSWFSMWMGLEINMLSFIPLMNEKNNPLSSEASLKYFIVQAISSMIILFSFLISLISKEILSPMNFSLELIFSSALLMKMGAAPFHFWFPEIIEGISWFNTLILLTWQKLAPMILVMYNLNSNIFLNFVILSSLMISGLKNWNQTSIKKILAFSSINHMGWLLSIILINQSLWMFYFMFYIFVTFSLILMFKKFSMPSILDLFKILNSNKPMKLFFMLNFLSLGGLPPFLGFFPKWMILKTLWFSNHYFLALTMVFLTLIMLFVYLRILYQGMVLNVSENKMMFSNPKTMIFNFLSFCNLTGLIIFSLILNL